MCSSCVPRVLLGCSSGASLVLRWHQQSPHGVPTEPVAGFNRTGWSVIQTKSLLSCGAEYADQYAVPKVIYKADGIRRGFITAMLSPVNYRQAPKFGVRQTMWVMTLAFGTVAVMRLLLAH